MGLSHLVTRLGYFSNHYLLPYTRSYSLGTNPN